MMLRSWLIDNNNNSNNNNSNSNNSDTVVSGGDGGGSGLGCGQSSTRPSEPGHLGGAATFIISIMTSFVNKGSGSLDLGGIYGNLTNNPIISLFRTFSSSSSSSNSSNSKNSSSDSSSTNAST